MLRCSSDIEDFFEIFLRLCSMIALVGILRFALWQAVEKVGAGSKSGDFGGSPLALSRKIACRPF